MVAFDFDAAIRWARFDPLRTLARRQDSELPFVGSGDIGQEFLLDTCVYIDSLEGRAPETLLELADLKPSNHSTVAIQELMHAVGALRPEHPGARHATRQIGAAIKSMPPHRVFTPDADVLCKAALLAGMLCRLQGYARDARLRAVQDCTLFLQAQELGLTVLTANVADFDILSQLIPAGRVLFYRRAN